MRKDQMCIVSVRFFRDDPNRITRIRWYPAEKNALDLGINTTFFSRRWDRRTMPEDQVGELYDPWERARAVRHPELFGTAHCGTKEQWAIGCLTTDPIPEINPNTGHFICCPAAVQLAGGGGGGGPLPPDWCTTLPGRISAKLYRLHPVTFFSFPIIEFVWTGEVYQCVTDLIFDFPSDPGWPGLEGSSTLNLYLVINRSTFIPRLQVRSRADPTLFGQILWACIDFPGPTYYDTYTFFFSNQHNFFMGALSLGIAQELPQQFVGGGTRGRSIGGGGGGGDIYFVPGPGLAREGGGGGGGALTIYSPLPLLGGGGGGGAMGALPPAIWTLAGGGGGGGDIAMSLAWDMVGGGGGGGEHSAPYAPPLFGGGGGGGDRSAVIPPLRTIAGGGGGGGVSSDVVPPVQTRAGGGGGGGDSATS